MTKRIKSDPSRTQRKLKDANPFSTEADFVTDRIYNWIPDFRDWLVEERTTSRIEEEFKFCALHDPYVDDQKNWEDMERHLRSQLMRPAHIRAGKGFYGRYDAFCNSLVLANR